MRYLLIIGMAVVLTVGSAMAESQTAGYVKTLNGKGHVVHARAVVPAQVGQILYAGDTVCTGQDCCLGILFEDDTLVSLGPNSLLELKDYAFQPESGLLTMAVRLMKGSFAYVSGIIGRFAPQNVRVETPDAVISTYGTRFLVKVEGK